MHTLPPGFYDSWWYRVSVLRRSATDIKVEDIIRLHPDKLLQLMLRERLRAFSDMLKIFDLHPDESQATHWFRGCLSEEWQRAGWSRQKIADTLASYGMRLDINDLINHSAIIYLPVKEPANATINRPCHSQATAVIDNRKCPG